MFNSMLIIRLKSIFKHLLISAGVLSIGLICLTILDLFTGKNRNISTYPSSFVHGFSLSLILVWVIVLFVLSFRMTRPYLEFGLQNGVSRRINFLTHVISMVIGQLVAFSISYSLFLWAVRNYAFPRIAYDSFFIFALNIIIFMILATGIQTSSFITLFDKKIWWVVFVLYMIWNWTFNKFISPIISSFLPSWLKGILFEFDIDSSDAELTTKMIMDGLHSSVLWTGLISSIIFSLVVAAICQYFIQTKRISLGLVRSK